MELINIDVNIIKYPSSGELLKSYLKIRVEKHNTI